MLSHTSANFMELYGMFMSDFSQFNYNAFMHLGCSKILSGEYHISSSSID